MLSFYSVSIYSETDGETSVLAPANIPRKTAATTKLGVDRSIIDKGDNDYEETQHSDGKVGNSVWSNIAEIVLYGIHEKQRSNSALAFAPTDQSALKGNNLSHSECDPYYSWMTNWNKHTFSPFIYCIYPAVRQGFLLSRMTSYN